MRLNSRTRIYKMSKLMNKIEMNELNFNEKKYIGTLQQYC